MMAGDKKVVEWLQLRFQAKSDPIRVETDCSIKYHITVNPSEPSSHTCPTL